MSKLVFKLIFFATIFIFLSIIMTSEYNFFKVKFLEITFT